MKFDEAWVKLNEQKMIDGDIQMTPEQAKKFAFQFYVVGYRAAIKKDEIEKQGGALAACWDQFDRLMIQMGEICNTVFGEKDNVAPFSTNARTDRRQGHEPNSRQKCKKRS